MRAVAEAAAETVDENPTAGARPEDRLTWPNAIVLAPPLGEVPLPARNVAALLRRNGLDADYCRPPCASFR